MAKTLVVIAGPTAIGKTTLTIKLAQYFKTEIISGDSRQCFRELTIGTAKPDLKELQSVQHYFINSHSIADEMSAAIYEKEALSFTERIFSKNDIAFVAGGTGMYIKALCEGLDKMEEVDPEIEKSMISKYQEKGIAWLQNEVEQKDPLFYETAEKENPHRLIRALVYQLSTGKSIQQFKTGQAKERPFNILKIGLELPRQQLYERINQRVLNMMEEGLLEEVKSLQPFQNYKSLQTVGYSELFAYLDNKISLEKAVDLIQQHSRNYAKRQMTWFKKDKEFIWIHPEHYDEILKEIMRFLN